MSPFRFFPPGDITVNIAVGAFARYARPLSLAGSIELKRFAIV
jgi:hypothetical protein